MARGFDLGVGRRSAGILGDEYIDLLLREKRRFRLDVEGAATGQQFHIGRQRDVAGRIDRTRNVVMMRTAREGIKLQAAERQENTARVWPKRIGGGFGGRGGKPAVARLRLPGGTNDRDERDRKLFAGGDGVGRDLIGVGMRGVDHRFRCVLLQPCHETIRTAEAADPRGNGLRFRLRGASGKGNGGIKAPVGRKPARQLRGFRGTPKDENAHRDQFHEC